MYTYLIEVGANLAGLPLSFGKFLSQGAAACWRMKMGVSMSFGSPVRMTKPKSSEAPIASLGNVEFITLSAIKDHAIERLADLACARPQRFVFALVESGSIVVTQRGRRCQLEEGQYALFDCSAGIAVAGIEAYKVLAIFVPSFALNARLRNVPMIVAQPFAWTASAWRIAANLVRSLTSEIKQIPVSLTYGYASQVVELLSVAVEADWHLSSEFSGRAALLKRCTAYVKCNVADSSLDPQKIADAMRISVRYLHKVFEESGESVCEFLRSTRLEASKAELADPQKASTQIREIARRVGFRSQAHFAAAFKCRYGVSATEWRKAAIKQQAAEESLLTPSRASKYRQSNVAASLPIDAVKRTELPASRIFAATGA
jgi:AraC-like DNA-binding protein